jgi:hypothetical protein
LRHHRNGTTHIVLAPVDFIARIAARGAGIPQAFWSAFLLFADRRR